MNTNTLCHDTIRLDRRYPHPPSAVFGAYADVERRRLWSAPSDDEEIVFDTHDFRVGGTDQFRCGLRDRIDFAGTTRYEQIVADELIVYTERLVTSDGALQAMSLVTWSLVPDEHGCRLTVVDQVTSVAGDGPIAGSRAGYTAVLEQLAAHLDSDPGRQLDGES